MSTIEDFERRYQRDPDPWRFATSPYEQRRYDITVACLPRQRYRRAFEPGCSVGELARRLAHRCDALVCWDVAPTVVETARQRLAEFAHVDVAVAAIPERWPAGTFDLVVLSELGYYFGLDELHGLADRAVASLDSGGTLIATHWLGHSTDHVLHGDEVHGALAVTPGLDHHGAVRDPGFRVDWWNRR